MKYVQIIATKDGPLCVAPAWKIDEGNLITVDGKPFEGKLFQVTAVATDEENGDFIQLLKAYYGYDLPKVKERYYRTEVEWDVD